MLKKLLALSAISLFAAGSIFAGTVKIGLMGPMTGDYASEGQEMKLVLELLASDINKAGGINGDTVEVMVEDDAFDPRTASLAANRLSTRDIVAVVGTYGSSITEATQNIYDESEIIQIANGATSNRLTEKGLEYFLRTSPRNDEQSRVAAKTIKSMNFKRIAVLHDNSSFAKGLASETKDLMKKQGMNIVFYDALTPKQRDYNTILTQIKATNPDVVFFTGYYSDGGTLLKQAREMGWKVPFLGGDATNNPDLVKIAGKQAADGFMCLSPPLPNDLINPQAKAFLKSFKAQHGRYPTSIYAVLAGDGFRVIVEAVKQTRSTDADKLVAYMKNKMDKFPGLTGQISFDKRGDRVGDVYRVYKVNAKGQFVLQPAM